ncbi:SpaA isopeptide-forming pilin-related protein [Paeniglutamicibacter terrestris]|uniref:LPXTG cell wall anchor domain-containing protein n=1 Tax=Paeniglutamicibacter terrestris TaxID=2723403 RepID=A0ABX1G4K6_9MICC|nr:SpaA isopeptide-forming pilin-related protein [Paeniglutamicibacter terrestris]NKG21175.1 LPXTG cell wall anchor domain-containing protein [Paeniglutamicibacter terrestris]
MRKGSLLATIWQNGIVRSMVGASATTALVATMMFGGGGFNPAVASTANDQAVPTEQPLVKATQSAEATPEASAAKTIAITPSAAAVESEEPVEKKAPATKAPTTAPDKVSDPSESAAPESKKPVPVKPTETLKSDTAVAEATKKSEEEPAVTSARTETGETTGVSAREGVAVAAVAGVCDTNLGGGKIGTFMQRSDITSFANGNLSQGLYEGGYVHQRVEMIEMPLGENELVFTYQVRQAGKWAYDFIDQYSMTGATITNTQVDVGSGNDRVDTVHLTFNVTAPSVTLLFSAHIASELDHGPGTGASSINGSPYHVTLSSMNCASTGSRDNQISASSVQAGFVTIIKDAVPADGTDFNFELKSLKTSDTVEFQLDDSAVSDTGLTTIPDRSTYTVAPGGVTISEKDLPAGWNLSNLSCVGVTSTVDLAGRTVSFTLLDNAAVTCTFTNNKTTYKDLTVSKTAIAKFDRDYDWTIEKNLAAGQEATVKSPTGAVDVDYSVLVKAGAPKDSNFVVDGVITVVNANTVAINAVTLSDTLPGAQCSVSTSAGISVGAPVSIPVGTSTFRYTCAMPAGTNAATQGINTVTATWSSASYFGTSGQAVATRSFTFVGVSPTVTDGSVTVTDTEFDLATIAGGNVVTVASSPRTFDYSITWPGVVGECSPYINTATYLETDGGTGSDSATVDVCLGADLVVTKNVTGAFNRSYPWDIEKTAVDGDGPYETNADGEVVVDYQVTVTPGTPTDSNWAMTGVMTVENPNDWQDITATLSDSVDVGGGAQCVVTGVTGDATVADLVPGTPEFDAVIAKNSTMDFDYSCTFTSLPSYTGINTATATWDMATAFTPTGTASGTAAVSVGTWTETALNKTVTITDDHHIFDPAWTITWTQGMLPQVKNYSITWTVPENAEGKCADFTNTATVTGNNGFTDTDNATISACYPPKLNVEKTSDPVTGSYVEPGSTVEYTLSFENSGGLPADVNYVDHLADVFDDATFNLGSLNAETGLTAVLVGDKIVIDGSVAPGTTVIVSYSVTVKTAEFGNGVAINFLLPDGENPPETCDPEVVECTEHPILGSVLWEKVDVLGNALSGSEWEVTGPGETAPQSIEDCIAASAADCTDLDIDPAAGAFKIKSLEWGVYALKETKAPAGFILDPTVRTFTIGGAAPAQMIWDFDPIENEQQPGLDLPLTGGMGSQTFLFAGGIALLASLALVAWRRRKEGDVA